MFQATSLRPYREYQDAMEYLRRQYRQDMAYREHLLASNPFSEDADAQEPKQQTKNNQGCTCCSQQEDQ